MKLQKEEDDKATAEKLHVGTYEVSEATEDTVEDPFGG